MKAMITIENQNEIKMSSTVELDGVKAHERKEIVLFDPQKLFLPECSGDWWLNIRIVYKERPAWAEEEYEVAFHQELLKKGERREKKVRVDHCTWKRKWEP